ncbi:probable G-protein coupled receptor 160 [Gracilinanus agilis]|uniref:probable G-protein coupled receptor 160 n=1 Tax=Gracilinanus agilis TaxID=191870 RepID=UPI001CFCD111|nr:probable G-protein coupled receptor 160 [Gracilinanus agilis]
MLLSAANRSLELQSHPGQHPGGRAPDPSGAVLLLILAKTLLNLLMSALGRRSPSPRFLECFCASVACADFLLLASLSAIGHFQDFALWGMRFTKYHICLFPQVLSFTYGVLPCPVFLLAGLDHYLSAARAAPAAEASVRWRRVFYFLCVLFVWTAALAYVLGDPVIYASLSRGGLPAHRCPFYASAQSYWLAVFMLGVLLLALAACWCQVVALVRSVQITSFGKEPALYFPQAPAWDRPSGSSKPLLARLLVCFLGTWLPFVLLQTSLLCLDVRVPAYMELNVPWLYFVNSFLVAAVSWCRRHEPEGAESAWRADPFVSWKFCFTPFPTERTEPAEKAAPVIVC